MFGRNKVQGIPKDKDGKALYGYVKEKDFINEKENYRYHIVGDGDYRPDEIEGKPVPVGSTFFDWKYWKLYYMRNTGWATKDVEPN